MNSIINYVWHINVNTFSAVSIFQTVYRTIAGCYRYKQRNQVDECDIFVSESAITNGLVFICKASLAGKSLKAILGFDEVLKKMKLHK